jgi:hypothetical protein
MRTASDQDKLKGVAMGRVLSIHVVIFALVVAGCSSRRSDLDDTVSRSRMRRVADSESKTQPKKETETVARAEKAGSEEQTEKNEDWQHPNKSESRKLFKGAGQFANDVAMAALVGVTVGLLIAVVFVAGAQ